jgi:hypothetical protein
VSTFWDGVNDAALLSDRVLKVRTEIADAARDYAWDRLLEIVAQHPDLVNSTRPGGQSLYAPLHQAAHGGASVEVVERLVAAGAWRTHQNARGERPLDVAERQGHDHLVFVLEPEFFKYVPIGVLLTMQHHFHAVICARGANHQIDISSLRLPELEPLLEQLPDGEQFRFFIPGMYGGFNYWLAADGVDAKLVCESWSRVVGGSGQRHEITSSGATLVAEGFV